MALVVFTQRSQIGSGQLIASGPVGDCLDKLQTGANTIDTAQIAALAVTAAKIEAQQAWQTIALTGLTGSLSYFKDSLGIVHFRGDQLTATSPAGGSTLCTLPVGYRPGVLTYLGLLQTNAVGAFTVVTIDTAGAVKNASVLGTNTWSFGMMHFRAEN